MKKKESRKKSKKAKVERVKAKPAKQNLAQFLMSPPWGGSGIEITRIPGIARRIDL
jgi:hypothetical protein